LAAFKCRIKIICSSRGRNYDCLEATGMGITDQYKVETRIDVNNCEPSIFPGFSGIGLAAALLLYPINLKI